MKFSEQIKKIRTDNSMTQEELSERLNVSRQTISSWENDRNLPDLEMVVAIAKSFQLSLDTLILGGENMTDKLIKDGSETRKSRMNLIIAIIGACLLFFGMALIVIKGLSVEYIDSEVFLHENFFLLPIGFLFIFSGVMAFAAAGIRSMVLHYRYKKRAEREE